MKITGKEADIFFFPSFFSCSVSYWPFPIEHLAQDKEINPSRNSTFRKEEEYREELISQKERNKELTDEIAAKQEEIREFERSFSTREEDHAILVEEAKDLRLLLGVIPAIGQGVRVTLKDADYDPIEQNPNDYIVHESHILRVVNELRISGAQGHSDKWSKNNVKLVHKMYRSCHHD